MRRYVVADAIGAVVVCDNLSEARDCAAEVGPRATIYELGPEVTEPDPWPLVEWLRRHYEFLSHLSSCAYRRGPPPNCTCGIIEALRKAGIEA